MIKVRSAEGDSWRKHSVHYPPLFDGNLLSIDNVYGSGIHRVMARPVMVLVVHCHTFYNNILSRTNCCFGEPCWPKNIKNV